MPKHRSKHKSKSDIAREALAQVISISCYAGFGQFDSPSNALDDQIESAADKLLELLTRCLSKKEARQIIDRVTADCIVRDCLASGMSLKEAREVAGDPFAQGKRVTVYDKHGKASQMKCGQTFGEVSYESSSKK